MNDEVLADFFARHSFEFAYISMPSPESIMHSLSTCYSSLGGGKFVEYIDLSGQLSSIGCVTTPVLDLQALDFGCLTMGTQRAPRGTQRALRCTQRAPSTACSTLDAGCSTLIPADNNKKHLIARVKLPRAKKRRLLVGNAPPVQVSRQVKTNNRLTLMATAKLSSTYKALSGIVKCWSIEDVEKALGIKKTEAIELATTQLDKFLNAPRTKGGMLVELLRAHYTLNGTTIHLACDLKHIGNVCHWCSSGPTQFCRVFPLLRRVLSATLGSTLKAPSVTLKAPLGTGMYEVNSIYLAGLVAGSDSVAGSDLVASSQCE